MAMVQGSLVSRWRGTIKVVCMQERGNKPYRQVGLKSLMVRVIQLLANNSFAVLSAVQSIATTFATPVHWEILTK